MPEQPRVDGYVRVTRDGVRDYEHVFVLKEALPDNEQECFWCGRPVYWETPEKADKLVVDHLDHDRGNNVLSNLVPSCGYCNSTRKTRQIRAYRRKEETGDGMEE